MGIHGTVSYIVLHRTREVGIRMALGASSLDVLRLVAREGAVLIISGLLGGGGVQGCTRKRDHRAEQAC